MHLLNKCKYSFSVTSLLSESETTGKRRSRSSESESHKVVAREVETEDGMAKEPKIAPNELPQEEVVSSLLMRSLIESSLISTKCLLYLFPGVHAFKI